MTTIKLKRYYPYLTENVTLEVSDEIARTENVVESAVCSSIRRGVKNLTEILKNFYG